MSTNFAPTLTAYAAQLPLYLVWLAGLILAIVFWRRAPKAALLAMLAILGFFVLSLVTTYLNLWLPITLYNNNLPTAQIGTITGIIGIVGHLISAVLWILILVAIFSGRKHDAEPKL